MSAPLPKSVLAFDAISKQYGATLANRNITFQATQGSVHAIVGENGAGKTTLMRILNGSIQADGGSISFFGKTLKVRSPREAMSQGIGMVYQKLSLIPGLTVFENLLLGSPETPF